MVFCGKMFLNEFLLAQKIEIRKSFQHGRGNIAQSQTVVITDHLKPWAIQLVHFGQKTHQLRNRSDIHRISRIHNEIKGWISGIQSFDHGAKGVHIIPLLDFWTIETTESNLFPEAIQHHFQFGMTGERELLQGNMNIRQVPELQNPPWGARG